MTVKPSGAERFSVLLVCTGNVCRSPAIERVLRHAWGIESGVEVTSAGTHARAGSPIDDPMASLLRSGGLDVSGFSARQLQVEMVRNADLVLGATRRHRAEAVMLWPSAVQRSFTFLEFARWVESVGPADLQRDLDHGASPAERLAALLPLARRHRSPVAPQLDDIEDPYGKSSRVHERVLAQIQERAEPLLRAVMPR